MQTHGYNREEFNDQFYSKVSMVYLLSTAVAVSIFSVVTYTILRFHGGPVYQQFEDEVGESQSYQTNRAQGKQDRMGSNPKEHKEGVEGIEHTMHTEHSITESKTTKIINPMTVSQLFFKDPRWMMLPLLFFSYVSGFLTSISLTFVRAINGFYYSKPPEEYESNFEGVAPWMY